MSRRTASLRNNENETPGTDRSTDATLCNWVPMGLVLVSDAHRYTFTQNTEEMASYWNETTKAIQTRDVSNSAGCHWPVTIF
jgi:hypothetical protein